MCNNSLFSVRTDGNFFKRVFCGVCIEKGARSFVGEKLKK